MRSRGRQGSCSQPVGGVLEEKNIIHTLHEVILLVGMPLLLVMSLLLAAMPSLLVASSYYAMAKVFFASPL